MGRWIWHATAIVVVALSVVVAPAGPVAAAPGSEMVLVPYNVVGAGGAYQAAGGGHDATSYWIVYHDKWHAGAHNYAVVVRVTGGLPTHFAWAPKLFPKPAPTPAGNSPLTVVGPTLKPDEVQSVRDGLAPIPRSAFFALARAPGEPGGIEAARRSLSAPHMSVPVIVSAAGSLATGFLYEVVIPNAGVYVGFWQIPLRSNDIGLIACGYLNDKAAVLLGFPQGVDTFSVFADGHKLVSSRPARDPLVPSMRFFALTMPYNVKNVTTVVNDNHRRTQSLQDCIPG